MTSTADAFDLDIRIRPPRAPVALDPPTETDPDSHEATCGSACSSQGPGCRRVR
ncbi:hypothetical protein ACFYO1_11325 [Nocardia sp. NPDC006044]|uniref:hypothetical protein n=1 Tax=Nocardia sp. NPDC006044 TaxID=3364306 RepID=UPI003681F89E